MKEKLLQYKHRHTETAGEEEQQLPPMKNYFPSNERKKKETVFSLNYFLFSLNPRGEVKKEPWIVYIEETTLRRRKMRSEEVREIISHEKTY